MINQAAERGEPRLRVRREDTRGAECAGHLPNARHPVLVNLLIKEFVEGIRPSAPVSDTLLTALPEVTSVIHRGDGVVVTGTGNVLNAVISVLARSQIVARQLRVDQGSLEDAFLELTGRGARNGSAHGNGQEKDERR